MNRRALTHPSIFAGRCQALAGAVLVLIALLWVAPAVAQESEGSYSGGDRARDLVVWITGPDVAGSGVVFGYDGKYAYVMTAFHVAQSRGQYRSDLKVEFRVWPGKALSVDPTSILARPGLDFAAFKVDLSPLGIPAPQIKKTLPLDSLGSSKSLVPGDRVFTVGHTFDYQWLIPNRPIFFHSFTHMDPDSPEPGIAQVEYQCPPGHSGGALFDENWRFVGLILNTEGPFCWALRVERALGVLREFGMGVDLYQKAITRDGASGSILPAEIKVAVVDFDNRSGENLPNLGPAAHDIISTFLVSLPRVVVLTRDRIDTVKGEAMFPGTQKNAEQITRLGKLLDADAVLTGSVVRYDVKRREFRGFGTSALSDQYRMTISLLLVDTESGRIRFAETFDVEDTKSYPQVASAPRSPLSRESELLQMLLDQSRERVQKSLMDLSLGTQTAGEIIKVAVSTVPEGADVLIGGVWLGSTPTEIELPIGLHEVEISRPGHRTWRRQVQVKPGSEIQVNLARVKAP